MGFLQNLEHLAAGVGHSVGGAVQGLEHAVGIGNQPQQRIIEDPIGPQLQQQLQNLPRYAQMPHAQMLPYMGSNGQPEPTTQQVAPNSVLNHPQVSQPSFIQQLMSILHGSSQSGPSVQPSREYLSNMQNLQVRPSVNPVQLDSPYNDQTAGGALQGYNQNDLSNGIQGGVVNQGYIPLQGSRFNNNQR